MRHNIVVRHATAVLAAWIIIALLAAPFSTKIENVTSFNVERLLPNGTDSSIAEDLLSNIMNTDGGTGALAYDVVLVKGVWADDRSLIEWDKELSGVSGRYVDDYVSPYRIAREVLENIEPDVKNGTHEAFEELSKAYPALHDLYMNREEVLSNLRLMNELVHNLIEWGREAEANLSSYEEEASELVERLEEAKELYINLSRTYNQTVAALEELGDRVRQLAQAIAQVDEAYSRAYASAQQLYPQIIELNQTAAEFAHLYNLTASAYTKLVFDVSRIHYYLLTHTHAYERGLTEADIAGVINYTSLIGDPVTPEEVAAVYAAMIKAGPTNASVDTVHAVAAEIAETAVSLPQARALIPYLSGAMTSASKQLLEQEGLSSYFDILGTDDVGGQAALATLLKEAVREALPAAAERYAQAIAASIAEDAGIPWAKDILADLIAGAASLGYPPDKEGLENLVVVAVAKMASMASGMPEDQIEPLARAVYEGGPTPEALKEWLLHAVSADPRVPREMAEMIVNAVISHDPGGTAYLAAGDTQALLVASEIVGGAAGIDPSIVFAATSSNTTPSKYAIELIIEKAPPTVDRHMMESALRVIASENGRLSPEGFAAFVEAFTQGIPASLAESLAQKVWEGGLSTEEALKLVLLKDLAEECFASYEGLEGTNAVETDLINLPIIDAVIQRNFTVASVADTLKLLVGGSLPGNVSVSDLVKALAELPPDAGDEELVEAMASAGMGEGGDDILVDILVRGEHPLEALASKAAEGFANEADIDEEVIKPAISASIVLGNETVLWSAVWDALEDKVLDNVTAELEGRMVSPDRGSFIILFKPRESPSKYENALSFRSLVESTLESMGKRPYFVGVTGDDVLMEEAMNASKADIDRVNKISIIAPVLISLALIGGLVAAGLPFLGIGLSVLTSSAALYALSLAGFVDVTSWSRMLMITTSFGLGMDYSAYIVLRFKEKIAELGDAAAAAHDALMHSLPAIAAASSTDIIGFAVMTLAKDFPLLASIGKTVPVAILAVLAASLTFTPAVLAKFGGSRWFWWPHRPEAGRRRWSGIRFTKGVATAFILTSLVIAGVGAYGLATFQGSHDYSVFMPEGTEGYTTYEALKAEFPAGQLLPVYVVGVSDRDVHDPAVKDALADLASRLGKVPGVEEVKWLGNGGEQYVGADNRTFYMEVIMTPSPLSREGIDVVARVKEVVKSFSSPHIRELHVGGVPAASLEMEELLERDFWGLIFPVSLVLMWLAMAVSFRSVWSGTVSLATIGVGYMLGVWAASAIPGAYWQPALWFLPLMTFPAVLGVGMDYNSFFLNREREEIEKIAGRPSAGYVAVTVTRAVRAVSHLVIGLGTIVAATYASLLIGSSWGVRELGLALTVGVVATTLMAALLLTPAILAVMSEKAWWPYSRRWRRGHGNTQDF